MVTARIPLHSAPSASCSRMLSNSNAASGAQGRSPCPT
jgi:hypothetical protein